MKIRQINLEEENPSRPKSVVAELSLAEVVFIVSLTDKMNDIQARDVIPGGDTAMHSLNGELTGNFLHRFFVDGVKEARARL